MIREKKAKGLKFRSFVHDYILQINNLCNFTDANLPTSVQELDRRYRKFRIHRDAKSVLESA
jgi:hypothetical protein